jgi:hypothetical protein
MAKIKIKLKTKVEEAFFKDIITSVVDSDRMD